MLWPSELLFHLEYNLLVPTLGTYVGARTWYYTHTSSGLFLHYVSGNQKSS